MAPPRETPLSDEAAGRTLSASQPQSAGGPEIPPAPRPAWLRALHRLEEIVVSLALGLMVLLPLIEIVARATSRTGVPGSSLFVQNLTLWIGFLGAALAAREDRLLALATGNFIPEGPWRRFAKVFSGAVGAAVCVVLLVASWELMQIEREAESEIMSGVRVWVAQLVMPVGYLLLALRLVWMSSRSWKGRGLAAIGLLAGAFLVLGGAGESARWPGLVEGFSPLPGLALILLATILGGPIFVAIGGAALLFFMADGVPEAAIPAETYRLAESPFLAAIPLFTLTGFFLAEGKASERLLAVFRALFGWMPGGTAVVTAVICAFFTIFTGGSGVTILALGGLLFPALVADRYREQFSLGLLTASGSLGLLLPPALPLILYGIVAEISITDLFIGGVFPGLLLIGLIAAWGLREGIVSGAGRTPFHFATAGRALWRGKWELLLPVFLLWAIFSGVATLVEAAALSALYAFVIQCFVQRDLSIRKDLFRVVRQCAVLVGGVLIILAVAMGLTSYLVDAQVAQKVLDLVQNNIESRWVFLICLNLFLLLVGCLMDIFSATVVVVPLIIPLGLAFDIHPVHLGIIFIANLELGYLTPPVGLNLFLASYRFERPLLQVYRAAVPMLVILGIGVLLITYVPYLTLGLLDILGRGGP